jgi:flavin prenyltransferase
MATPSILLAVTGATGAVYARRLLQRLLEREACVGLTISDYGREVARQELGVGDDPVSVILGEPDARVVYYDHRRVEGPFVTGSAPWRAMLVVPCSMGTVGRIASGVSNDLITRAADVALKEQRTLLIAPRETPFNLIHLRNLTTLAEAGAIVFPLMPAFYHGAETIAEQVDFLVERMVAVAR